MLEALIADCSKSVKMSFRLSNKLSLINHARCIQNKVHKKEKKKARHL